MCEACGGDVYVAWCTTVSTGPITGWQLGLQGIQQRWARTSLASRLGQAQELPLATARRLCSPRRSLPPSRTLCAHDLTLLCCLAP